MLYVSAILRVVTKNNLYLIQKYLIIRVNKFNNKPINHKHINKEIQVLIEIPIVLDKNNKGITSGKNIKLNPESNSLTKIKFLILETVNLVIYATKAYCFSFLKRKIHKKEITITSCS